MCLYVGMCTYEQVPVLARSVRPLELGVWVVRPLELGLWVVRPLELWLWVVRHPGAGVVGSQKPPDLGVYNSLSLVLGKSSTSSKSNTISLALVL